jgi:hypothetical protein
MHIQEVKKGKIQEKTWECTAKDWVWLILMVE